MRARLFVTDVETKEACKMTLAVHTKLRPFTVPCK